MQDEILDTEQVAVFLKLSIDTVREKAKNGQFPAIKIGRAWRFYKQDLVDTLRLQYASSCKEVQATQLRRNTRWHCTKEDIHGGLGLPTMEKEYNAVLGLQTDKPRKNFMTKLKRNFGE